MEKQLWQEVEKGNVAEVEEILRNHPTIKINWRNHERNGRTAFHEACINGHSSSVSLLLAHPDINVNQKDKNGATALLIACRRGYALCARLILKDSRVQVKQPNNDGYTPLWHAASRGCLDIIQWCIASAKEMDLGQPGDKKTDAIGVATRCQWSEIVACS